MSELKIPKETDSCDCHFQQTGIGSLICTAARTNRRSSTNEVDTTTCFNCPVGQIYREVGCDAVSPKLQIIAFDQGNELLIDKLLCMKRKRETTIDYCRTCDIVTAETTREIVSTATGLFKAQGFDSAYNDLEMARKAIRDGNSENAVTRSISCLESVMCICHEKLDKPLPSKKQVTDLWKSTRTILKFDEFDTSGSTLTFMNSLSGVVSHIGGLRNSLGDAHGKGVFPPEVSESIAEFAINTASALSTIIIRRYIQLKANDK